MDWRKDYRPAAAWGLILLATCASCSQIDSRGPVAPPVEPPAGDTVEAERPRPHPQMMPAQVVQLQIETLRNNDAEDTGILAAFEFCSAANGPRTREKFDRFADLVKRPAFRSLFDYTLVEIGPTEMSGPVARQLVYLVRPDDEIDLYLFVLIQQADGPRRDCWLTEAILLGQFLEDGERGTPPLLAPEPALNR